MRLEGKPESIKQAVLQDTRENHRFLSKAGRKGAEHAANNRAIREAMKKERLAELIAEQAKIYRIADGDVLPPDPNDIAGLE